MKITKNTLKRLIKEEFNLVKEARAIEPGAGPMSGGHGRPAEAISGGESWLAFRNKAEPMLEEIIEDLTMHLEAMEPELAGRGTIPGPAGQLLVSLKRSLWTVSSGRGSADLVGQTVAPEDY